MLVFALRVLSKKGRCRGVVLRLILALRGFISALCCFGSGRDAGQSDEMEDIHSAKRNVNANGDMVKRVDAKKLIRYSKLYDMHQW